MIFYSQTDNRWKAVLLGFNLQQPYNLGNFACLITAWGNMLVAITGDQKYTPVFMNEWLKANLGFAYERNAYGTPKRNAQGQIIGGGIMYWQKPLGIGFVNDRGQTTNKAQINDWIADEANYAIIEVKAGSNQHFVLGIQRGLIIDSADGKQKSIDTYPIVNAHLYRASGGMGSVTVKESNEDEPVITNSDNEFGRWNDLFIRIRGRASTRDEFKSSAVGRTWLQAIEILTDGAPEAVHAQAAQELGEVALRDNWQGQIEKLLERTRQLTAEATDKDAVIAELQARLAAAPTYTTAPTPIVQATATATYPLNFDSMFTGSGDGTKQMDSLSAATKLHTATSQGYGLLKRLERSIHNAIFNAKI
jgi:hypothetical protein